MGRNLSRSLDLMGQVVNTGVWGGYPGSTDSRNLRSHFGILLFALPAAFASQATAATLRVPDPYPTIASALNAASYGDSVLISAGNYSEHSLAMKDGVYLGSEFQNPSDVVIDAAMLARHLDVYDSGGSTKIAGLTFRRGSAQIDPGSVLIENSAPTFESCLFEENAGCAILSKGFSSPRFINCAFFQNVAESPHDGASVGGAVLCVGPSLPSPRPEIHFMDCHFRGNVAGSGGAVFVYEISSVFIRSTFEGNISVGGEAMQHGGGALVFSEGSHYVSECVFFGNSSSWGGDAIYCENSSQTQVTRSTFASNSGSVVMLGSGSPSVAIRESVIAFNGGYAVVENPGVRGSQSELAVSCCDVFGNAYGDWVGLLQGLDGEYGNFSLDPQFCDFADNDFSLAASSPCLPQNNSCSTLIGALVQGCGTISVESKSWGAIKGLYR